MPQENVKLDPSTELPAPHDMLLPMSHWQKLRKKTFIKTHKKLSLLVLIFLLISCALGYSYYHFSVTKLAHTNNENIVLPSITPSPSIIPSGTLATQFPNEIETLQVAINTIDSRVKWQEIKPDSKKIIGDTTLEKELPVKGFSISGIFTGDASVFTNEFEKTNTLRMLGWKDDARFVGSGGAGYSYGYSIKNASGEMILLNSVRFERTESPNYPTPCDYCKIYISLFVSQPYSYTNDVSITSTQKLPYIEILYRGGLCPEGVCETKKTLTAEGIMMENNKKIKTLSSEDLQRLRKLINNTNYTVIKSKPFTGTCPTAYDGQETVYTFYTDNGKEIIEDCTYAVDKSAPLFKTVLELTK